MGKIKSKLIRRSAKSLVQKGIQFTQKFDDNKLVLGNILPSKKIRNQIAGLLAKMKQAEAIKEKNLQKSLK